MFLRSVGGKTKKNLNWNKAFEVVGLVFYWFITFIPFFTTLPCTESSDLKHCNQVCAGVSEKEIPCALLMEEK